MEEDQSAVLGDMLSNMCSKAPTKVIVLLGTSPDTKGGISTVVDSYRRAGLFDRWPIVYIVTHVDGRSWRKMYVAIKGFFQFIGLMMRNKIWFVHVLSASNGSYWRKSLFMLASIARRCPVIFHLHGGGFLEFYERCGFLKRNAIRFVLNRAAHIVVLSNRWKLAIEKITSNQRISCIYNAVADDDLFNVDKKRQKGQQLLFMGEIQKRKGAFDILEALSSVLIDFPTVRLVYAGEGRVEELVSRARELGVVDAIECLGWVAGETRRRLFASSDILLLPSYTEGLPMVILEAMAAGVPVITTTVGGIPDVIENGTEGLLISPGDIEGMTAAIRRLLADKDFRERLGRAGREKALRNFSLGTVIPALESVYLLVIANDVRKRDCFSKV